MISDNNFVTSATSDQLAGYTPEEAISTKEFKRVLGNRIYLEYPEPQDGNIIIDGKTKDKIREEYVASIGRLRVYAVGDTVTHVKEGDEVMVDGDYFQRPNIVTLSKERKVLVVPVFQISHIW